VEQLYGIVPEMEQRVRRAVAPAAGAGAEAGGGSADAPATPALGDAPEPVVVVGFGHLGDGNLHLNVMTPGRHEVDSRVLASIEPFVYEHCERHRGSISAEHGLGQLKRAALGYSKPEPVVEAMRGLKRLMDPKGILNPGKVLPPADAGGEGGGGGLLPLRAVVGAAAAGGVAGVARNWHPPTRRC
jgi:FAD/FMN-containing dehydrogenase